MQWISEFEKGGVEGLKLKPGRGRKSILNDEEVATVKTCLQEDFNLTIKAVKLKIEQDFGKQLGMSATNNLLRKLNFSYITPRAKHYKQDKSLHKEFKKKS
ncbi:MAG: hypothetical protein HON43_05500 [Alphaproteobacteria bacterium]|jgi:transposase|nr:hypothetical protein [Alphaproteobacteria bacterium]MBT5390330.1 hypothetical protein [Alphaproteobacteria bacterium]